MWHTSILGKDIRAVNEDDYYQMLHDKMIYKWGEKLRLPRRLRVSKQKYWEREEKITIRITKPFLNQYSNMSFIAWPADQWTINVYTGSFSPVFHQTFQPSILNSSREIHDSNGQSDI